MHRPAALVMLPLQRACNRTVAAMVPQCWCLPCLLHDGNEDHVHSWNDCVGRSVHCL